MLRKWMTFGILLLFFIGSFSSFCADTFEQDSYLTSKKNVILVDDDGDGDYTSLKVAVNNSNSGDIIEIYSGTYNESNIVIFHPISIIGIPYELGQGNDTGKPLIKQSLFNEDNILIRILSSFVSIGECIFQAYNESGLIIYLKNSNYCTVFNNDFKDMGGAITIWSCYNTVIQNNTINNAYWGGILMEPSSNNNTICNNIISNVGGGWYGGIDINLYLEAPYNCSIVKNHISNCSRNGIYAEGSGISITDNVIENCNGIGISSISFKSLLRNRIYNCSKGIKIICNSNIIKENLVSGCEVGMKIRCQGKHMSLIEKNEIRNSIIGMNIDEPDVSIVNITRNNFIQNKIQAIFSAINPSRCNSIWGENYWGKTLNHPKPLFGFGILLFSHFEYPIGLPVPWICFDMHPAQEPYDIT